MVFINGQLWVTDYAGKRLITYVLRDNKRVHYRNEQGQDKETSFNEFERWARDEAAYAAMNVLRVIEVATAFIENHMGLKMESSKNRRFVNTMQNIMIQEAGEYMEPSIHFRSKSK